VGTLLGTVLGLVQPSTTPSIVVVLPKISVPVPRL
jgi:hypothetical protein